MGSSHVESAASSPEVQPNFIEEVLRAFTQESMVERALRLRDSYEAARPFPHIQVDNMFPEQLVQKVAAEFSDATREDLDAACSSRLRGVSCHWLDSTKKGESTSKQTKEPEGLKSGVIHPDEMGPYTTLLFMLMRSPQFVKFLESLTGVKHLFPDPHYKGSGLHMTRPGGYLQVHADFNFLTAYKIDRRVNVFLYLNENWEDDWGGHLELWRKDMT
eukprot:gene27146-33404_t